MGRETSAALKDLFARVETWPEEAQAEAVRLLEEMDGELKVPLSAEDLEALARSEEDVRLGRFVSAAEISALFDRYRGG